MTEQPQRLRVLALRRELDEDDEVLPQRAAERLGVDPERLVDWTLTRRSLDARGRPHFKCHLEVELDGDHALDELPHGVDTRVTDPVDLRDYDLRRRERVAVIGAGPAGLFCAYRMALAGLEPIVVDRGEPVEVRGRHVSRLMHHGELRPDSNVCFGEGGAGTWSDGKLYTRVNDERVRQVLETIVEMGGPPEILVAGKPHLGTDRLVALCKAFRAALEERGCAVRYGAFVEDFVIDRRAEGDRIVGLRLRDGEQIDVDRVVLAVGHSAREMYHHLAERGVAMEAKPFAVGFRVEHRQALIDEIQYGRYAGAEGLPTAEYSLSANYGEEDSRRGVYSFCMCPGGQVMPTATTPGRICVNGMSHASRRGHWANSALVVTVAPSDFGAFGALEGQNEHDGVLAGLAFQEEAERRAYELGGGGFIAPAQRLTDYRSGRPSADVRKTTYKPGIAAADVSRCYPDFVHEYLRQALDAFEEKMEGFLTDDALLIGVETRTSAPVRILRGDDDLQSPSLGGLYPAGEGAGYGGGIVSAAVDGIRIAERILEELSV